MMEAQRISSIEEYIKIITKLSEDIHDTNNLENSFLGKRLLFRGQANNTWELLPTLGRLDYDFQNECMATMEEKNMIEMAQNKMPDVFSNDLLPLELLALLQHHGMPTRLLDVSENALVALFFACCEYDKIDGEVIVFRDNSNGAAMYPIVQAAADTYNMCVGSIYPLYLFLENALDQDYFKIQRRAISNTYKTDKQKESWVKGCYNSILYVYAPIRTMRQLVQDGRYILFPNEIKEIGVDSEEKVYCFTDEIKAIPKDHSDIQAIITIPHEIKNRLLRDLSVLGITRAKLLCDSPDELCRDIKGRCKSKLLGKEDW